MLSSARFCPMILTNLIMGEIRICDCRVMIERRRTFKLEACSRLPGGEGTRRPEGCLFCGQRRFVMMICHSQIPTTSLLISRRRATRGWNLVTIMSYLIVVCALLSVFELGLRQASRITDPRVTLNDAGRGFIFFRRDCLR
jgi:hypothetical protein